MLLAKDVPKNLALGRAGLHLLPWQGGGKQAASCGAADRVVFAK
jgi:hypothetical protein